MQTDFDKRSNDIADHTPQKPVSGELHRQAAIRLAQIGPIDGAHGMGPGASRAFKPFEIVGADHSAESLSHGLDIERPADMPDILPAKGLTKRTVVDSVSVGFSDGAVACVKRSRHLDAITDNDIPGKKGIDAPQQGLAGESCSASKTGHLPERVYPAVRPAGTHYMNRSPGHHGDDALDFRLNGRKAALALPSMIGAPIVFDNELERSLRAGHTAYRPAPPPLVRPYIPESGSAETPVCNPCSAIQSAISAESAPHVSRNSGIESQY